MSNEFASAVGRRVKQLRERKGMSRAELAKIVNVDMTALSCWETGKYLPRDRHRAQLARALGVGIDDLFDRPADENEPTMGVTLPVDDEQVSTLLSELLEKSHVFRILRLSYPFSTATRYRLALRRSVATRILEGNLELRRVEVFYSLDRLKEVLSNILRFDGRPYWVKGFAITSTDVFPGVDVCFGDRDEFLFSSAWNSEPAEDRPRLWLSGRAVGAFMREYWNEVWHRGRLLNIRGAHDLVAVHDIAIALGLKGNEWPEFLEAARNFEIGDGAPPMP